MISPKINTLNLFLSYFVFGFILIYLIYSPAIHIPFYHHDTYALCTGGLTGSHVFHFTDLFTNYTWLFDPRGRPFVALWGSINVKYAYTLEGMSHVRFGGTLFIGLFASSLAYWLYRSEFTFLNAILVSIMVFCLPGIQTAIIMNAWFLVFTPFIAFIAWLLINKGFKEWNKPEYVYAKKLKSVLFIICGLISLFISLFTYPAESGFFLVPALIYVLFRPINEWSMTRKLVIRDTLIFIFCCAIYFTIVKMIQISSLSFVNVPHSYTLNVNSHIIERIIPLFGIFSSLWNIQYDFNIQATLVYLVISFSILLRGFSKRRIASASIILQSVLAVFVLLILGSVAYILQPDPYIFTRILFIFQVMSLFIFIWAIKVICDAIWQRESNVFLSVMVILFFIGSFFANYIVAKSALNDNMELNHIASYLTQNLTAKNKINRIHLVGGFDSRLNFNGLKSRDDIFNVNTTIYRQDTLNLLNTALLQITKPRIDTLYDCALDEFILKHLSERECMLKAPKHAIVVTYSRQGEKINYTPNMLIIDMTKDKLYTPKNPMPVNFLLH